MSELREEIELPPLPQSVLMRMRNNNNSGRYLEATQEALYGRERQLKSSLAANREQKAEIERLKSYRSWDRIHELEAELASLRASAGEKWIDVKQEMPPIAEGNDISEILMGSYGFSWDLVRLHRTKGWITLPRWDRVRNPIISWHRLPAPPSQHTEEER